MNRRSKKRFMALIKNHKFTQDQWVEYEPDLEPDENTKGVIFTLQNITACSHNIPEDLQLGIKLVNHDPVSAVIEHLNTVKLIILEFPSFADGRAYSQAQALRQQIGFDGELRAVGNVLIDQYAFMLQCGFNSFQVPKTTDLEQWKTAARIIPTTYTATQANHHSHIWKLRKVLTQ